MVAFLDITQRKKIELEIRQLAESLEGRIIERTAQLETPTGSWKLFATRSRIIYAHPLRHIAGFSRIFLSDYGTALKPEAKGHLSELSKDENVEVNLNAPSVAIISSHA